MEFSTNKITPNDNVKIPSMNGNNSGYQLDSEMREYVQAGVSGVTEQYSNLSTYAYGKRLKHEGVEYRCIVPVETPENFDPDKWVKVDLTELDKRVLENASAINAIMPTLLWTNPDPSSSFSAQSIPLDLSQYQLILILTRGTGTVYKSVIGIVGTTVGVMDNDNTIRYRDFNITSTGIAVGTGCFASAYNGSILVGYDDVAKPYKIYGIKL